VFIIGRDGRTIASFRDPPPADDFVEKLFAALGERMSFRRMFWKSGVGGAD
jgi:hypothetical protein